MKIFKILFFALFLNFFSIFLVSASDAKIENIFKDIDKNYKYYNELQVLYERWIIQPDKNGNFNPNATLTREEFVWIVSEVSCKECIQPNVDFEYVQKYSNKEIFFDISNRSKYFYCIASAVENEEVSWYHESTVCENWISKTWEKPFCPENNIILEEALAIILRSSNILTLKESESIRQQIKNWINFPTILWNISPTLNDGSVYSFYPDFKKALEYTLVDYDSNWVEKKLKLLDISKTINPKAVVTREDFLRISYIALKNNSCQNKDLNSLWLKMEVLNKTCSENKALCELSDFPDWEKVFDFRWKIWLVDDTWFTFNWRFYDYSTWWNTLRTWKFIDNYDFLVPWKYRVYLNVSWPKWETSEVYSDLKIKESNQSSGGNTWLTSNIDVDKLTTKPGDSINFTWNTNKWWDVTYTWDFWDWKTGTWKNISHNYWVLGNYTTTLTVIDGDGNTSTSTVVINISNTPWFDWWVDTDWDWVPDSWDYEKETPKDKINFICTLEYIEKKLYSCSATDLWVYNPEIERIYENLKDTDGDWVPDNNDYCLDIKWEEKNFWCPIFEKTCRADSDCKDWFFCENGYCKTKQYSLNCSYDWWHIITWNLECNTCPCNLELDFNAKLRACDVIFPAITSPDNKNIYSKWKYFQIKK